MKTCLLLALFICVMTFIQGANAAPPVSFERATADYRAGKYQKALIEFEQYKIKYPTNLQVHYYEALCYQGLNKLDIARDEFDYVVKNDEGALKSKALLGIKQLDGAKTVSDSVSGSSSSALPTGFAGDAKQAREGHLALALEYVDAGMCPACQAFGSPFWHAERQLPWLRTTRIDLETNDPSIKLYKVGKQHPYVVLLDGVGKVLFSGRLPPDENIILSTFKRYE